MLSDLTLAIENNQREMSNYNEEILKSFLIYIIDIMVKKKNISFIKLLLNVLTSFLF